MKLTLVAGGIGWKSAAGFAKSQCRTDEGAASKSGGSKLEQAYGVGVGPANCPLNPHPIQLRQDSAAMFNVAVRRPGEVCPSEMRLRFEATDAS